MKTIKLTLSGGFHNAESINVVVPFVKYEDYKNGLSDMPEILTTSQFKKLDRHFCGINGCCCGSYTRADITIFKR